MNHNPECFASHMGLWAIEPRTLTIGLETIRKFNRLPERFSGVSEDASSQLRDGRQFHLHDGGVAILEIRGATTKGASKFGTSTIGVRRALRAAVNDPKVRSILLNVDSPGGHHAGTHELSEDIRKAAQRKPVHAFVDDLAASAAVYAISGASKVVANAPGEIGSIGTFALVVDDSKQAELAGVKVHLVSTGGIKGEGAPGVPVSDELVAEVQKSVDRAFGFFRRAVMENRGISAETFKAVSGGRMFGAEEALGHGLIDGISTFDEALAELQDFGSSRRNEADLSHRERLLALEELA